MGKKNTIDTSDPLGLRQAITSDLLGGYISNNSPKKVPDFNRYAPANRGRGYTVFGDTDFLDFIEQGHAPSNAGDLIEARAQAQSFKVLKGLGRSVPTVLTKFTAGLGSVLGFIGGGLESLITLDTGKWMDRITHNVITDMSNDMEDAIKDAVPIYKTRQYLNADSLWDKITTAEFWGDDFADGLAFMASALIPGGIFGSLGLLGKAGAMSKFGLGAKMAPKFLKFADKFRKAKLLTSGVKNIDDGLVTAAKVLNLSEKGSRTLTKLANNIDYGVLTAYNTVAEAGMESRDIYDQLLDQGIDKKIAGKAAANTMISNMAALMLSNFWETKMIFGGFDTARITRKAYKAGKLEKDALKNIKVNFAKNIGVKMGEGVAVEGFWEENIQHGIQKIQTDLAINHPDKLDDNLDWMAKTGASLFTNLNDVDGQTAVFLGGLLGGFMGAVGGVRESIAEQNKLNTIDQILKLSDFTIGSNIKSLYKTKNITDDEGKVTKVEFETDEEGNPIIDPEKATKLIMQTLQDKTLLDAALAAETNGNGLTAEVLHEMIFARHAFQMLNDGRLEDDELIDILKTKIDLQMNARKEEIEGEEDSTQEEKDLMLDKLREIYNHRHGRIDAYAKLLFNLRDRIESQDYSDEMKARVLKAQYSEGVKQLFLEDLLNKNKERLDDLTGIATLDDELLDKVTAKDEEIQKVLDDSYEKFDLLNNKNRVKELDKHTSIDDFLSMQEEITKLDSEINDATPENAVKLKKKQQDLKKMLEYAKKEQARIYGQTRDLNGIHTRRDILTAGENEFIRVNDIEGDPESYFHETALMYLQEERLDKLIRDHKEDKASVRDILEFVNNKHLLKHISKETRDKVLDIYKDTIKDYQKVLDEEKELNKLKESLPPVQTFDPETMSVGIDEQAKQMHDEVDSKLDDIDKLKTQFRSLEDLMTKVKDRYKEETKTKKQRIKELKNTTRNVVRNRIADEITKEIFDAVYSIYQADPDNFTDIEGVERAIDELKIIKGSLQARTNANNWKINNKTFVKIHVRIRDLEDILKKAKDNANNRDIAQDLSLVDKIKQIYKSIGVTIKEDGSYEIDNNELTDTIKEVVGETYFKKIMDDAKDNAARPYHPIYAEVIIHKIKNSRKVKSALKKQISLSAESIKLKGLEDWKTEIKSRPSRILENYIHLVFNVTDIQNENKKNHPFSVYKRNQNFYEFYRLVLAAPENSLFLQNGITKDEIVDELKKITHLISYVSLAYKVKSDFDIVNSVVAEINTFQNIKKENGDNTIIAPSIQQEIALRELQEFWGASFSRQYQGNIAYLKGIAGTGKTTAMSFIVKYLGLSKSEILASGHSKTSSHNLNQGLGIDSNKSVEELTKEDLKGKKLIIVDEIAGTTFKQFEHLIELTKDEKIKVIVLGDPLQIIRERVSPMDINVTKSRRIDISPLTVVYRTDVGIINTIGGLFRDNFKEISNVVLSANNEIGQAGAMGMHSALGFIEMDSAITNNATDKSAIIVANEEQRVELEERYKDSPAKVILYTDAQGRTFDNVFIFLNKDERNIKNEKWKDIHEFNTAMYNMVSRAQNYAVILGSNMGFTNSIDPSIGQRTSDSEKNKEENEIRHYENKKFEHDVLSKYLDDVEKPDNYNPSENPPPITPPDTDSEDDSDDNTPVPGTSSDGVNDGWRRQPPTGAKSPSNHRLWFPSSRFINLQKLSINNISEIIDPLVKAGSKVVIYRTRYEGEDAYYVLGQLKDSDKYGQIAILSKEELETEFGKNVSAVDSGYGSLIRTSDSKVFKLPNGDGGVVYKGTVSYASPLSYEYSNAIQKEGNGITSYIKDIFEHGMFVMAGLPIPDGIKYEYKIYTKKEITELEKIDTGVARFGLHPGVPYMAITIPGHKIPQHIRLNSRALNETDDEVKTMMEFMSIVDDIEKTSNLKLGTQEFNDALSKFRSNYSLTLLANGEVKVKKKRRTSNFNYSSATAKALTKLVPYIYTGVSKVKTITEEEFEKEEYDTNKFDAIKRGKNYVLQYKNTETLEHIAVLSKGKGKAQNAFNRIALANSYADSKDKETYKQHKQYMYVSERRRSDGKRIVVAKSLVTDPRQSKKYYQFILNTLKDHIENGSAPEGVTSVRWINEKNVAEAEAYITSQGIISVEQLHDIKESFSNVVTSDFLKGLFKFDESGNHSSSGYWLRKPLFLSDMQKSENEIEKLLTTKVKSITPTEIEIENSTQQKASPSDNSSSQPSPRSARRGRGGRRTLKSTDDSGNLGVEITLEEARKLAKQLIPGITEEELEFVSNHILAQKALPGEDLLGLMEDGVVWVSTLQNGKTVHKNVLRHELFHLLFNYYLATDFKNELLNLAKNEINGFDTLNIVEQEEKLAVLFQNYVKRKSSVSYKIGQIFKKLLKLLGFVSRKSITLNDLFEQIEHNEGLRSSKQSGIITRRTLIDIRNTFKTTANYRAAENYVIDAIYDFYDSDEGIPLNFTESIIEVLNLIKEDRSYIEKIPAKQRTSYQVDDLEMYNILLTPSGKNRIVYDDLINEIYPNFEFSKSGKLLKPKDNEVNLSEHITSVNTRNEELSTTDLVKHFMYNIVKDRIVTLKEYEKYWKDHYDKKPIGSKTGLYHLITKDTGEIVKEVLDPSFVYVKLLQGFTSLDLSKNIISQLSELLPNTTSSEGAIFEALATLYERATNEVLGNALISDYNFGEFISPIKFVINRDKVKNPSKSGLELVIKRKNMSTEEFLNKIAKLLQNKVNDSRIDLQLIIDLYRRSVAANLWTEISSHFGSQRESHLKTIKQKYHFVRRDGITYSVPENKYINSKQRGHHTVIKGLLHKALSDNLETKADVTAFLKKHNNEGTKYIPYLKSNDLSEKFIGLKGILRDLGLKEQVVKSIPLPIVSSIANNFYSFLVNDLKEVGDIKNVNKEESENIDNNIEYVTTSDVIDKSGNGILNSITAWLIADKPFLRATSAINAEGEKVYLFHMSSNGIDIIDNLLSNGKFAGSKGKKSHLDLPSHLEDSFYEHNIFMTGFQTMHRLIDHDGTINNDFGTLYKNETDAKWMNRVFNAGFIDVIAKGLSSNPRYIQYFYTISDRPNIMGVEVNVLDHTQIKDSIKNIILQHLSRPIELEHYLKNFNVLSNANFKILNKEDLLKLREAQEKNKNITKLLNKIVEKTYNNLQQKADTFTDTLLSEKFIADINLNKAKLKIDNIKKEIDKNDEQSVKAEPVVSKAPKKHDGKYVLDKETLHPMAELFYMNNYINSYSLNQLVTGDYAAFKSKGRDLEALDLVKRMSGVFGPGKLGNTDLLLGNKPTYKTVVVEDTIMDKEHVKKFLEKFYEIEDEVNDALKKYQELTEITDGQGFILPNRRDDISKSYGASYGLKNVLKPSYYGFSTKVINGVTVQFPVMLKYSATVLSDSLVNNNPVLRIIRDNMEKHGIDELVFESAIKEGVPKKITSFEEISTEGHQIHPDSILELHSDKFRLQLNPYSDIDAKVTQPTQLLYFLSVLKLNDKRSDNVYQSLGEIIKLNRELFGTDITESDIIKKLKQSFKNNNREQRSFELLNEGLSVNFPALTQSSIIQFASMLSKDSVQVKFPGSKLILQTDEGIVNPNTKERLQYVNKNGEMYVEAIVPKGLRDILKKGDFITSADAVAFRVPTSGLHSALPIKIVGFYDTENTNSIIVPRESIAILGFDFDVDSLFILRREYDKNGYPIGYHEKNNLFELDSKFLENIDTNSKEGKKLAIKYHKNIIIDNILKALSSKDNIEHMLSPISLLRLEKYKEEKSVDLSDVLDNRLMFRSNFDSAALTGVFANASKSLGYLAKLRDGNNNSLPLVVEDKFIKINGKIYNSFVEFEENTNISIFETLDSLLNAALDNVKVQILYHINANGVTGNAIAVLVGLGINLDTIVDILNQPVIRLLGTTKSKNALFELRNDLYEAYLNLESREYNREGISKNLPEINDDMLKTNLNKDINNLTENEILNQLAVLEQFEYAMFLGEKLADFSKSIKFAKELPVFVKDIKSNLELWNTVKSKFIVNTENIEKRLPHLYEGGNTLAMLNDIIAEVYDIHGENSYAFLNQLKEVFNIKIKYNSFENTEELKKELVKYIISGIDLLDEIFETPPSKIGAKSYNNIATWNRELIQQLLDEFSKLPNNILINYLNIRNNKISFTGGGDLNASQLVDFEDAFLELSESLQQKLIKYELLNNGTLFGTSNLSSIIPGDILQEANNEIIRQFKKLLPSLQTNILETEEGKVIKLENTNNHLDFLIQVALNNSKQLPYVSVKAEKETKFLAGVTEQGLYYDLKFLNPQTKSGFKYSKSAFPKFIKRTYNETSEVVYMRVTDPLTHEVLYQKIGFGRKHKINIRTKNVNTVEKNAIESAFSGAPYFKIKSHDNTTFNSTHELSKNEIVYLYVDDNRLDAESYEIVKAVKRYDMMDEFLGYMYTVKKVKSNPSSKTSRVFNLESKRINVDIVENINEGDHLELNELYELVYNSEDAGLISRLDALKGLLPEGIKIKVVKQSDIKGEASAFAGFSTEEGHFIVFGDKSISSHSIVHELTHIALYNLIDNYIKVDKRYITDKQYSLMSKLEDIFYSLRNHPNLKGEYGLTNLHEFISEVMSNSEFREKLSNINHYENNNRISLLDKILNFIKQLLGFDSKISNESIVSDSVLMVSDKILQEVITSYKGNIKSNSSFTANLESNTEDDSVDNNIKELIEKLKTDITNRDKDATVGIENGEEADYYIVNGEKIPRVHTVVSEFSNAFKNKTGSIAERAANKYWIEGIDHDTKLNTDLGEMTYETYVEYKDKEIKDNKLRGKINHKILETAGMNETETMKAMQDIKDKLAEIGMSIMPFQWLFKNKETILEKYGINIKDDVLLSEKTIYSTLLNLVGTPDLVSIDKFGRLSITDWKTGSAFNVEFVNTIMKYGDQVIDVTDSQRTRAKLQIMLYALMIKMNNPEATFKHLQVAWIPGESAMFMNDHKSQVEINVYLNMLETYFKTEKPEIYETMIKESPNIFNHSHYSSVETELKEQLNSSSAVHTLEHKQALLTELISKSATGVTLNATQRDQVNKLTYEIIELKKDPSVILNADIEKMGLSDMTVSKLYSGLYSDTDNPFLHTFEQLMQEGKEKVHRLYTEKKNKFDRLMLPIFNNYLKRNGKSLVANMTHKQLNFVKYYIGNGKGLFDFAYVNRTKDNFNYLDFVTPSDAQWSNLSDSEKRLMLYIIEEFKKPFDEKTGYLNKVITKDRYGRDLTSMDLINRNRAIPFKYTPSFMPRVPMGTEEVRQQYPLFSKEKIKHLFRKHMTTYIEDNFEGYRSQEALPMKYLGNSHIISSGNYSKNLEIIFDKFIKGSLMKEHMQDAYSIGKGLEIFFDSKKEGTEDLMPNTTKFLKEKINMDILDKHRKGSISRKKLKIGKYTLSPHNITRMITKITSAPIMWLQPINGTRNGIFISMLNAKKAVSDSIYSKLAGVEESVVDFTLPDLTAAWGEWAKMSAAMITGNGKHNKMWLMAKEFRYLPDNYDWATRSNLLMTERKDLRTAAFGSRTMYMFHTLPEEWHAMMIMVAQMKNMKHNGKSMYDNYEVVTKDGVSHLEWVGGVRGVVKNKETGEVIKELRGLDHKEMIRLKRVYQQMHGGYRRDERTVMEAFIWGKLILQFKKYLPSVLQNAFKSKHVDYSIGNYEFTGDKENGVEVMEWVGRMTEGRWLVMGKVIANMIKIQNNPDYKFKTMPPQMKKELIDGLVTLSSWALLYANYLMIFAGADDDDSFKKLTNIIIQNYSQQYNIWDIGRNFTTAPASITKTYDATNALGTLMLSSMLYSFNVDNQLTNRGELRGWTQTRRSLPYLSTYYNIVRFMEHSDDAETYIPFRVR